MYTCACACAFNCVVVGVIFPACAPAAECTPDLMELIKIIARIYVTTATTTATLNLLENLRPNWPNYAAQFKPHARRTRRTQFIAHTYRQFPLPK